MSLRQEFFDGIEELFTELDDLVDCVTYRRTISTEYIPGGRVPTTSNTFPIRIVPDSTTQMISGVSRTDFDQVYIIPAVDLNCESPSQDDNIIIKNGPTYRVDKWQSDPSFSNYIVGVKF